MTKKLTTLAFERAKPKLDSGGAAVRNEIADGGADGLYLIVQPSGAKSWAIRYRHNGRPTKFTLGGGEALSLAQARKGAADARLALEKGMIPPPNDAPLGPPTRRSSTPTRLTRSSAVHYPARTEAQAGHPEIYDSALRRFVLPKWGKRSVHEIRRRDVIALVEAIAVDRPVMANRTLGILSKFFNWLVARDVITASPAHGVDMPGVEKARDRVLDEDEVATLWHACADEGVVGDAVRIMLLTGARRTEVSAMRWAEIDEGRAVGATERAVEEWQATLFRSVRRPGKSSPRCPGLATRTYSPCPATARWLTSPGSSSGSTPNSASHGPG